LELRYSLLRSALASDSTESVDGSNSQETEQKKPSPVLKQGDVSTTEFGLLHASLGVVCPDMVK
jgi:hypothetical protein